jgi:hypothetical protein
MLLNCSCNCICIVFIVCSVSFIVCVVLCAVFCLSVVCYLCDVFIVCRVSFIVCVFLCAVFCLSVVCYLCVVSYCSTLPPGKLPFSVEIIIIIINIETAVSILFLFYYLLRDCPKLYIFANLYRRKVKNSIIPNSHVLVDVLKCFKLSKILFWGPPDHGTLMTSHTI